MIKEIEESPAHLYFKHLKNLNINFKTASDVKTVEGNITVVPEHSSSIPKKRKVGRNEPCPCGSGKKYKKCCLENE
jgi:preprotein translocase subunit SecA